jgi:hypothetical protein
MRSPPAPRGPAAGHRPAPPAQVAAGLPETGRQDVEHGAYDGRLAAAGRSDQRDHLAGPGVQGQGAGDPGAGRVPDGQTGHRQPAGIGDGFRVDTGCGFGGGTRCGHGPGHGDGAGQHGGGHGQQGQRDGRCGQGRRVEGGAGEVLPQHHAPVGRLRTGGEAERGERGGDLERHDEPHDQVGGRRPGDRREDLAGQDGGHPFAASQGGLDVPGAARVPDQVAEHAQAERRAAADRRGEHRGARRQRHGQHQRQQQERHGQQQVGRAGQDPSGTPAGPAGRQSA